LDIWDWVGRFVEDQREAGNHRLAQLILKIPDATCDDRHAEVDALVPEALALARAQKHAWAEIFVRHWHLQSRVLHRHEVKDSLAEAVSLLEFANRPELRDCPQSVCVTQDLACCYGDKDGPGYVAERLAVASETLARIDPSWPCFDCISGEYVSALFDASRPADALEFIETQRQKLSQFGELELGSNLARDRAEALLLLGRNEEALRQLDDWDAEGAGAHGQLEQELLRARVLTALGRAKEAREMLPAIERISGTPALYQRFIQATVGLIAAGEHENGWRVGRSLALLANKLEKNGANYLATSAAVDCAELALGRSSPNVAGHWLSRAEQLLGRLRRPEVLRERLDSLRKTLDAVPARTPPELPDSADDVRDRLGDDPEAALELLHASRQAFPDSSLLARQEAAALRAIGLEHEAERRLVSELARSPESPELFSDVATLLLDAGRHDDLELLLDEQSKAASPGVATLVLWLRARSLEARGKRSACRDVLRQLVAMDASPVAPRKLLARLERELGDPAAALALLDALSAELDPGEVDWDRMVAATLVGAWDAVRASAARLGMELEGEGPVDVPMGLCRIRFDDQAGSPAVYFATRTGPVTARIIEIAGAAHEHFGDRVVFEAAPLNPDPPAEPGERHVFVFPLIETLERGGYRSFALDGVHPGDAELAALEASLSELGVELQQRSGDDYEVMSDDGSLRGVYALIAAPERVSDRELHVALSAKCSAWEKPVVWLGLAALLGDAPELERQREIALQYGL
jgi:tetratricopeptide (TPR) repeat protein